MDAIKGIIKKLHEAFPNIEIYTERIEQGFRPPCFSIRQLDSSSNAFPGGRYQRLQYFDVRYFPSNRRAQQECREMAAQLYEVLEYLPDNAARGTKMEWEITDMVLHFFVHYNYFVRKIAQKEKMGELKTGVHT